MTAKPPSIGMSNASRAGLDLMRTRVAFRDRSVADVLDLVEDVVAQLDAGELIFDHYHQFEPVEPACVEIVEEVCFVRDTFSIHAQMLGDETADLDGNVFVHARCCLPREADGAHDESPIRSG